jgi:uncharacterized protein DUF5670
MGNFLIYSAVVILVIVWLVGYFVFQYGAAIHTLLIIALVVVVLRAVSGRKAL